MLCRALVVLALLSPAFSVAAETPVDTKRGDALVAEYFRLETDRLTRATADRLADLKDPKAREEGRRQLREMLGLDPLPERTPLEPIVTGVVDHPEFTVEKVHFQSSPGLYVTGNLYLPKNLKAKVPAILYVCGHSRQVKDGVSFGNKAGYQHHGAWFARNGYVCLTIDTLQLGEIAGVHHGTHHENRWWWIARGYTPAGVEAWNCIRALDYLETRPEVDMTKIGVTGRSGGGAYSWWILGIDDRIQAAVPVAGITSLQNHVVDGVIAGHCDCMFQCNTYRWDYAMIPALFAPKPLLISNTDKDRIFPLEGVVDTFTKARSVYRALKADDKIGLQITEGPHKDKQELHIHAFVWMNRYLKGDEPVIEDPAVKFFEPEQLRVFAELPKDEINTKIDQVFVPPAPAPAVPASVTEWNSLREKWRRGLEEKVFRGWPDHEPSTAELEVRRIANFESTGRRLEQYEFVSQRPYGLPLTILRNTEPERAARAPVTLVVVDDAAWPTLQNWLAGTIPGSAVKVDAGATNSALTSRWQKLLDTPGSTLAFVAPRGIGPTEWSRQTKIHTDIRRRFALLGQTDDGMRTWDVRCAIRAVRTLPEVQDRPLHLLGEQDASIWTMYASLFEPATAGVTLAGLPASHAAGPTLFNVLRVLDLPAALALTAGHSPLVVELKDDEVNLAAFAKQAAGQLKGGVIQIEVR